MLVPDIKHYEQFLLDTIFRLPGVTHVRSSIVLREVKSEVALPIEQMSPFVAKRGRTRGV